MGRRRPSLITVSLLGAWTLAALAVTGYLGWVLATGREVYFPWRIEIVRVEPGADVTETPELVAIGAETPESLENHEPVAPEAPEAPEHRIAAAERFALAEAKRAITPRLKTPSTARFHPAQRSVYTPTPPDKPQLCYWIEGEFDALDFGGSEILGELVTRRWAVFLTLEGRSPRTLAVGTMTYSDLAGEDVFDAIEESDE